MNPKMKDECLTILRLEKMIRTATLEERHLMLEHWLKYATRRDILKNSKNKKNEEK